MLGEGNERKEASYERRGILSACLDAATTEDVEEGYGGRAVDSPHALLGGAIRQDEAHDQGDGEHDGYVERLYRSLR